MSPDKVYNMSIEYNDEKVSGDVSKTQDKNLILFICKRPLVIKPACSDLQVTYHTHSIPYHTSSYKAEGNIFCVAEGEITLNDGDRIELKLSISNRFHVIGF